MTLVPVEPEDRPVIDAVLSIYQNAIEASEQKSRSAFEAMLRDDRYAIVASVHAGAVTGFVVSCFLEGADFWLLEYLAVGDHVRSRGIGGALFRAALAAAAVRVPGRPCLIEVDQPKDDRDETSREKIRLRFYARQRCRQLAGLNYLMPPVGGARPPAMHLLLHGLAKQDLLEAPVLRSWLSQIYDQIYGRDPADPAIDAMLQEHPNGVSIRPLEL